MKIFAKRTKKKAESSAPRTVNKSDPIVEELLKKDASEWNAKERRMIKRYRDRKVTEPNEKAEIASTSDKEKTEDANLKIEEPKEDTEQEESDDNDSSSSSDDDSDIEKDNENKEKNNDDDDEKDEKEDDGDEDSSSDEKENPNKMVQHSTIEKEEKINIPDADKSAEEDGKVAKNHEIWSVLDKLNSKQKRTLSRKLDRIGKSALEEVEEEANKILDAMIAIEEQLKRDQAAAASTDKDSSSGVGEPKKKKQKKAPDWSSLPAEERLRREDQRRKQQEAAERKARGEAIKPGHKRPLNSERRRANRRKPKWGIKSPSGAPDIASYKQEHHSSGFVHRKTRHAQESTMNNY